MADLFADARALVAAEPPRPGGSGWIESYLHRLCTAAARAVPATGASLYLLQGDTPFGLLIASDETSKSIAELQVTLGDGPSVEVWSSRRPALEASLTGGGSRRWPAFAPGAVTLGACAMFAFPLQVGAARLGVLELSRAEPGSLTEEQLALALTFAEVAVLTMLDAEPDLMGSSGGFDGALADHAVLYHAQGMVMVQLSVRLEEAAARLRSHAYALDRGLLDVAHDVVARRINLERDPAEPGPAT